jgi:hypothetical protein
MSRSALLQLTRRISLRLIRRMFVATLVVSGAAASAAVGISQAASAQTAHHDESTSLHWSTVTPPSRGMLGAVSCVAAHHCFFISGEHAYEWRHANWRRFPLPVPKGADPDNTGLTDLKCTSSTDCIAVGEWESLKTLAYYPWVDVWNGKHWSDVKASGVSRGNVAPNNWHSGFTSAMCQSSGQCFALGYRGSWTHQRRLIERWKAGQKRLSVVTRLSRAKGQWQDGACSDTGCVVTTTSPAETDIWQAGVWHRASSEGVGDWNGNHAMSCLTPTSCIAILTLTNAAFYWDGRSWYGPMSLPGPRRDGYNDISCAKQTCVAVGGHAGKRDHYSYTLATHGSPNPSEAGQSDGGQHYSAWPVDRTTNPPGNADELESVSCTDAGYCVASGYVQKGKNPINGSNRQPHDRPLVEQLTLPSGS